MIPADEPCTPEGETPRGSSSRPSANGLLLAAGNLLTGDQGLTSARWQVLGAIALAQRPLTVPQIARRVGLTRRAICGTVGRLVRDGLLALAPNADRRRSPLVCLSEPGRATYAAIDRADLETTARVLEELCRRLEAGDAEDAHRGGGEGGNDANSA
jgi:DNA-binding MarR family transcriptional regulator